MGFRRKQQEAPKQPERKAETSKGSNKSSGKPLPKSAKLGAIMSTKDGERLFLSVQQEGDYAVELTVNGRKVKGIFTKTPEENLAGMVERGVITEEEMEERLSKIPDTVVAEVTVSFED